MDRQKKESTTLTTKCLNSQKNARLPNSDNQNTKKHHQISVQTKKRKNAYVTVPMLSLVSTNNLHGTHRSGQSLERRKWIVYIQQEEIRLSIRAGALTPNKLQCYFIRIRFIHQNEILP